MKLDPICCAGGNCSEFQGAINCFSELDGKWRLTKDEKWGEINSRLRDGCPTVEDVDLINENCHAQNDTHRKASELQRT